MEHASNQATAAASGRSISALGSHALLGELAHTILNRCFRIACHLQRASKVSRSGKHRSSIRVSTLTQPRKKRAKSGKPEQNDVTRSLEHYRALRWFAVISMLAIISWILIDLF